MPTSDDDERELRIEQMTVNVEKMRADMRQENRRFLVQLIAALGTAFGGGAATLALILHLTGKI